MIFPLQMAFSYPWYVWFDPGRFHHNYHAYRVFISQILQGEGNGGIVPLKSRVNLQKEPGCIWFAEHIYRGIKHVWLVGYLPASAFTILNALEVWFSELRSLNVVLLPFSVYVIMANPTLICRGLFGAPRTVTSRGPLAWLTWAPCAKWRSPWAPWARRWRWINVANWAKCFFVIDDIGYKLIG